MNLAVGRRFCGKSEKQEEFERDARERLARPDMKAFDEMIKTLVNRQQLNKIKEREKGKDA